MLSEIDIERLNILLDEFAAAGAEHKLYKNRDSHVNLYNKKQQILNFINKMDKISKSKDEIKFAMAFSLSQLNDLIKSNKIDKKNIISVECVDKVEGYEQSGFYLYYWG